MKKRICALLIVGMLSLLAGCARPNSLQIELSQGYGDEIKLIHLNASTAEKRERIETFARMLADAQPLEKELALFAYYPDYRLEITGMALAYTVNDTGAMTDVSLTEGDDCSITAIVDVNGEYVDFYFPGPAPEKSDVIYRSALSASEFVKLVNTR